MLFVHLRIAGLRQSTQLNGNYLESVGNNRLGWWGQHPCRSPPLPPRSAGSPLRYDRTRNSSSAKSMASQRPLTLCFSLRHRSNGLFNDSDHNSNVFGKLLSTHPGNSPTPARCPTIKLYSDYILYSIQKQHQISQIEGSVPQDYPHFRCQSQVQITT